MLALVLVYLLHAVWHAAAGEVPRSAHGEAVVVEMDPFVFAESQTGDGLVGCHFFCNHGCPFPPLPEPPALPASLPSSAFESRPADRPCGPSVQPEKAPPRFLA